MPTEKAPFTLYLAPWQARMIQDFTDFRKRVGKVIIKPGVIICPASYKIPDHGLSRHDWVLYLTDEQMVIVREQLKLKTAVSSINITTELINNKAVQFR